MKLFGDLLRDFTLEGKYVFQIAIVRFRPDVRIGASVDHLGIYVKPRPGFPDASFQHVRYAQRIADLARVVVVTILHNTRSADDLEIGDFRQLR
jgi:hypothetical protein